jgi:hypothetical protein
MLENHVEWTSPAPLWWQGFDPADALARRAFRTPAVLRFASDAFMDDFVNLMKVDPARLAELVALPETWSMPPGEPDKVKPQSGLVLKLNQLRTVAVRRLEARAGTLPAIAAAGPVPKPLKLYQPAHQRFYLVTACLVCRITGLPDRRLDTTKNERVSFVVRLLQPRAGAASVNPDPYDCDELAFIDGAWQFAGNPQVLLDGEETNPLSPLTYPELDGRRRRLFTGLVPVGKREAYLAASQPQPATDTDPAVPLFSAQQMLFKTQVLGPWASLEDTGVRANTALSPNALAPSPDPTVQATIRATAKDQIQCLSWYVFLDFANYLAARIPNVWNAISGSAASLTVAEQALVTTLTGTRNPASGLTIGSALVNAKVKEQTLENVKVPYRVDKTQWPAANLIFPLADVSATGVTPLSPALTRDTLESQVVATLPPEPAKGALPVRIAAQARANPMTSPEFAIRCVLQRPNCPSLTQPLVSEPSAAFQMAAYFDPDAPARPIRIGLPVDTTPAGLRKFDKNAAFVMSDTLCGQVSRVRGMTLGDLVLSVLPFPFHKGLDMSPGDSAPCAGGGMVCSFSIPIITICALLMLIVIVTLLDIIFFWMPFFQICLPLPKFSAKGGS